MAERISFLIIGNGIAGMTAAEVLRTEAPEATVGVIAEDAQSVYFRPALKDYLAGRVPVEKLWARPEQYYQQQRISFLPERVTRIQADQHFVQLQSGGQVKYEKLLVASGAGAAQLKCPGSDLNGVTTLRTLADYDAILARLPEVQRVVVSGSGTLALETVETLCHRGLQVSHLVRKQTLWSEVLDATSSDLVLQEERRDGVDVQLETEIAKVVGSRGRVRGVVTTDGQRISCELVLIAIGIEPDVDLLRTSGITCRRGVLIDRQMRTNAPDIYAAGDVVETVDMVSGQGRLIGQWYPAIQQARAAAYSMLDLLDTAQSVQREAIYSATFLYGLPFAAVGMTSASSMPGYRALVADPQPRAYRKVVLDKDNVPVGALALGERKMMLAYKRAIDYRVNLSSIATHLFDAQFDLGDWLDRQKVPPVQLGARRVSDTAGDTVVKQAVPVPVSTQMKQKSEDHMLDDSSPSIRNEAFLVHIADPKLPLRIAEITLERARMLTLGRQPGSVDMVIDEGSVSRQHVQIGYQEGHYVLCDLKSLNGTFINGKRVTPNLFYMLDKNDVIRLGNVVSFRVMLRALSTGELAAPGQVNASPLSDIIPAPAPVMQPVVAPVPVAQQLPQAPTYRAGGSPPPSSNASSGSPKLPSALVNALKETPALIVLPAEATALAQKQAPQIHLLQTGKSMTIGRVDGNDIQLADRVVSRQHAEIFGTPDGFYYVRDLGSSNGVIINQSKITQPYRLAHGDHIQLGTTIILFVNLTSGREQTMKVAAVTPLPKTPPRPPVPASSDDDMTVAVTRPVAPRSPQQYMYNQPPPQQQPQPASPSQRSRPKQAATGPLPPQTAKLPPQMVACPRCGVANMPTARFCASCSSPLRVGR